MGIKLSHALATVAAVAAFQAVPAQALSFVNGSFEDASLNPGSFTVLSGGSTAINGWTVGPHSIDYIGNYWTAQDGGRSIDLAGNGVGSIAQTFDTNVGWNYVVSFWVSRNPDGGSTPRTGLVEAAGQSQDITFSNNGTTHSDMGWELNTFAFKADDIATTLRFSADGSSGCCYGLALDNVSISVVPEPTTWGLMILGFGAIGGVLRRRNRQSVNLRFA